MTYNRFDDAWYIQQGACNPSGVARSLVKAIDGARAEEAYPHEDAAVRMIAHQLAFILNLVEYDRDLAAYGRDYAICEERKNLHGVSK